MLSLGLIENAIKKSSSNSPSSTPREPPISWRARRRGSTWPDRDRTEAASASTDPTVAGICALALHGRQSGCLVLGEDRVDDLVKRFPGHDLVYLVKGQIDPMIGNPPLRKVIGPDAL